MHSIKSRFCRFGLESSLDVCVCTFQPGAVMIIGVWIKGCACADVYVCRTLLMLLCVYNI